MKVLSNPSLVVVNNEAATLEVGDQVPVSTGSANVLSSNNAVVNTIDYKNTGIILHVQPRVNSNGIVLLDVEQEISSVPNSTTLQLDHGHADADDFRTQGEERALGADGQTVLLAGLISDPEHHPFRRAHARPDPARRRRLCQQGQTGQAHRTGAVHPPANHSQRRRRGDRGAELRAKMRGGRPGPFGAPPPGQ